jgi:hypothetical protein
VGQAVALREVVERTVAEVLVVDEVVVTVVVVATHAQWCITTVRTKGT